MCKSLDKRKALCYNEQCARLKRFRGVAQFGSALGSGPRGRRFESCHSDHQRNAICLPRHFAFFCALLAFFAISRGFSGFLSQKTGFRAAFTLFRSPIFSFSSQKFWCTFRVSLLCKENEKVSRRRDLNSKWCPFRFFFRYKKKLKS